MMAEITVRIDAVVKSDVERNLRTVAKLYLLCKNPSHKVLSWAGHCSVRREVKYEEIGLVVVGKSDPCDWITVKGFNAVVHFWRERDAASQVY